MHPKFGKKTKKFGTVVPLRAERVKLNFEKVFMKWTYCEWLKTVNKTTETNFRNIIEIFLTVEIGMIILVA